MDLKTFANSLLIWFDAHRRLLPWRQTRNPYAIWLSEIIMQQTRVIQGTAYWERFMQQYPTVEQLAAATEDEVLKLWQGLGYYSRARNLHKAARQIVELGRFPDTFDEIRKLKGVGDYTAAAISAFAFEQPKAAVDGNFYRVLARVFGIDAPIDSTEGKKLFQALADEIVKVLPKNYQPNDNSQDGGATGDQCATSGPYSAFNAAMMDFGATQCSPKAPQCETCPFTEDCEARRQGRVDQLPVKSKTVSVKKLRLTYIHIRCNGRVAMRRRGAGDIWQGLWEPILMEDFPEMAPMTKKAVLVCKNVKHVLTHRIIMADFYFMETTSKPALPNDYQWIAEDELENYAVPRLVELLIEKLDKSSR